MNTLNRFIIATLLVLFASQAFADRPKVLNIERTALKTLTIMHDQPVKDFTSMSQYYLHMEANEKVYVGYVPGKGPVPYRTVTAVNPDENGFSAIWNMDVEEFVDMDNADILTADIMTVYSSYWGNSAREYISDLFVDYGRYHFPDFSLCHQNCIRMLSYGEFNVDEGADLVHTLVANNINATFSIVENTNNSSLFTLNNNTLTFDGSGIDYETDAKSYSVQIKATIGNASNKNVKQTITVTIDNVFENTIVIADQTRFISENMPIGDTIGNPLIVGGEITSFVVGAFREKNSSKKIDRVKNLDISKFAISNGGQLRVAKAIDYDNMQPFIVVTENSDKKYVIPVSVRGPDAEDKTAQITIFVKNIFENTIGINNQTRSVDENSVVDTKIGNTLQTTGEVTFFSIVAGNTGDVFKIDNSGQIRVAKAELDYETLSSYSLTIEITGNDAVSKTAKITINIGDVDDISIYNQARIVDENAIVGTPIGDPLVASGAITNFNIVGGDSNFFRIDNTGQIRVKNLGLDYETAQDYTLIVEIRGTNTDNKTAQIAITIVDLDDTAPTNISLSNKSIVLGAPIGTVIGTLSATDIDSDNDSLVFSVVDSDFEITGNKLKINKVTSEAHELSVDITATDSAKNADTKTFVITTTTNTTSVSITSADITNTNISVDENMTGTVLAITTNVTDQTQSLTYEISGNDQDKFNLNGNILTFKSPPNYEDRASYSLILKVSNTNFSTEKNITIAINNINENNLIINDQNIGINKDISVDADIINVGATATRQITYSIAEGNDDGFFKINNEGAIQLAKSLAQGLTSIYTLVVTATITGDDAEEKTATITIAINNDNASIAISLTNSSIAIGVAIGDVVGTLSATNIDGNLTYSIEKNDYFKISGNKLKINFNSDTVSEYPINITVNNGTISQVKSFRIMVISAPIISQFTVTQGGNKGQLISKNGGNVTVSAIISVGTYAWSSSSFFNINTNDSATFVFNPSFLDVGTKTIKLKITDGNLSSTRVLKLKLVESHPVDWADENSNGVSDNKESESSNNQLPAGTNKKITSLAGTRLLLGIMGKDSGHLTFAQMEQYRADNGMSDITKDTPATGDIYDYVVEGLNATGSSAKVIIELANPLPAGAELRKYSLTTNSWSSFVVNASNVIASKKSTTCTDNVVWQTKLTQGATCLKLTIKDGGENDTDGDQFNNTGQANGVIESTIAIATSVVNNVDDSSADNNSGGGCVYNPNAPARFDIGFILLMILGTYYLIRRKRRFIR